jgi:DNA-binding response OmpR family regulator
MSQSISVLVASPSAADLDEFRFVRREFGLDWRLLAARDCREAWTVLHREHVDVVVVEAQFPDGFTWRELLDEIQNMRGGQAVVVTSRLADEKLWVEALEQGGFDVLARPFDRGELVRAITGAARHSEQQFRRARAVA